MNTMALAPIELSSKPKKSKGHDFLLPEKAGYCRACGGVYVLFSEKGLHLELGPICDICLRRYRYSFGRGEEKLTEQSFNEYLADSLSKTIARFKRTGVAGRCEALKIIGANPLERGYQCGHPASCYKDGRIVC